MTSRVRISGLNNNAFECVQDIQNFIREIERKRQQHEQAAMLVNMVQWCFLEVILLLVTFMNSRLTNTSKFSNHRIDFMLCFYVAKLCSATFLFHILAFPPYSDNPAFLQCSCSILRCETSVCVIVKYLGFQNFLLCIYATMKSYKFYMCLYFRFE